MNQRALGTGTFKYAMGAAALLFLLMLMLTPSAAFADSNYGEYQVKVDTGYLALRSAPAYDDSNVIGKLYTGDVVEVEEKRGQYWWVYSPKYDKEGYVNNDYLITVASYGDYTVKVDKNYLALRSAPAYDESNEIGELYTGDVVTVKGMPDGDYWWVYSPKYDECGYVNKDYLTTAPSTYGDYRVKVDKNYLALRNAPAYDESNEIGKLYTGDVVTVEEKRGGTYWWVYSPQYNREGYVNKDYLEKV